MKRFKKLFKNNKTDRTDLVITRDNHSINADELADYIRNLEAENRDLKDTTTEHNTISYKLGKTIIDTLNNQSPTTELPSKLLKIYAESRKRKLHSLKSAGLVDKVLILLTDEELLEDYRLTGNKIDITNKPQNINTKQNITTALSDALNTVEADHFILKSQLHNNLIDTFNKKSESNTENKEIDGDINSKLNSEALVNVSINDNNITELAHIGVQAAGDILELSAAVLYRLSSDVSARKVVVLLEFLDITSNKIEDITIAGVGVSAAFGQHFRYLNSNCNNIEENLKEIIKFPLPVTVASVKFSVAGMGLKDAEQVDIRLKARCYNEDSEKKIKSGELINVTINDNNITELAHIEVQAAGNTLDLSAAVLYRLQNDITSRKAVVLLEFLNSTGNKIEDIALAGVGVSGAFKQHFRYLNNNCTNIEESLKHIIKFKLPTTVASIKVSVAGMGLKDDEEVDIRLKARCYDEEREREVSRQELVFQPLPNPIISDPSIKRYTSDLNIACILDEFTTECLAYEVNLIKVTQEDWQSQMETNNIDFLLVESCWRGNDGNWGTLTKGSSGGRKLSPLLQYCKKNDIPTVFWNKEDPPHYEKFGAIAKLFDVAITTDINMVERYKEDFGIDVYPLSFGAQPKIHNPSPIIPKLEKAVFAGSYYGDKPQRCADFNNIMSQLEIAQVPYDIFDRNYHRNIDKFVFPDCYQSHIVGTLPPEDIWKVHKGYKYQVNMNSVQDSATMFARRVYESLASGTPVITNYSVGVQQLFGDLVIMPNKHLSVAEQLMQLESSPSVYNKIARLGVRRVMREHTYGHRIQEICKLLGMEVEVTVPMATLAITVNSEADIIRAKKVFESQTAISKQLFIELENFEDAYQYLNKSDNTTSYAMKLGHAFYNDESKYYGSNKVLKCNVNDAISAEALEDFIYWGAL
ncbi:glycosyltransferase [Psychrobacter sp. ANT_WB68]|uniref:CgeB family protein n=1 Tax=Psychrobacter sp. ANT_WB68 TaxID=2597355 RepID=UPI0011F2F27E|nr:glycosyltransferase [Psychrobacter sp. ANT_WB68]KAA0915870.1 glycosyltransferase [Psychrobacter sp. ANT_WB68]